MSRLTPAETHHTTPPSKAAIIHKPSKPESRPSSGYLMASQAAMAQAFNLPIANGGGWPHHNMHLQAAMANGWRVEFHVDMWKVGEAIYQNPPAPDHGWVTLAETPGLGLEPRLEALKEYEEK